MMRNLSTRSKRRRPLTGLNWRWRRAEHSDRAAVLADDCRARWRGCRGARGPDDRPGGVESGGSWTYALDTAVSVLRELRAAR